MAMPPNTESNLALLVLLAATSCSTLPERSWPPRLVGEIEVVHHIAPGGARLVAVPLSDERITILDLHAHTPAVEERWIGGRRFFVVPEDVAELRIHCRYRAFGVAGEAPFATVIGPDELFPGAVVVRHVASAEPMVER